MRHMLAFLSVVLVASLAHAQKVPTIPFVPQVVEFKAESSSFSPLNTAHTPLAPTTHTPAKSDFVPTQADFEFAEKLFVAAEKMFTNNEQLFAPGTAEFTWLDSAFMPKASVFTTKLATFTPRISEFTVTLAEYAPILQDFAATMLAYSPFEMTADGKRLLEYWKIFRGTDFARRPTFRTSHLEHIETWANIYSATYQPIKRIPIPKGFRIIAEIHPPKNNAQFENMQREIGWALANGYTDALLTFGLGEDVTLFDRVIEFLKSQKVRVWFAYVGDRDRKQNLYGIHPSRYAEDLAYLAERCDGFFAGGWASTLPGVRLSADKMYNYKPDDKFVGFTLQTIRNANPDIFVLGAMQYFQGEKVKDAVYTSMPKNQSGFVVLNFGVVNINIAAAIKNYVAPHNDDYVAYIVGQHYFWNSWKKNTYTKQQNQALRTLLENKWLAKDRCIGTITTANDESENADPRAIGENGKLWNGKTTNNLCETTWHVK